MSKRKCQFNEKLQNEFKMFKKTEKLNEVLCITCNSHLSIANKGRLDLQQHLSSKKHKNNIGSAEMSKSLTEYFVGAKEADVISGCEATLAYHTIYHHFSFRSTDCSSQLYATLFKDSKIANKISSARTKTHAIVQNVLSPMSLRNLKAEIENGNIRTVGVSTDGSNHGSTKIFPILIQYFSKKTGVSHKLLQIRSVTSEKAETITNMLLEALHNFNLQNKCVAFGGDNCNTNFGSVARKGQNNVFHLLKANENLRNIVGIGCPAHILNNCIKHATDLWAIDIESILAKIYNHFSIFTVRVETLKQFCEFVEIDYKILLSSSKTRWLSLFPAIERVLKLYEALKSYFLSLPKPPVLLEIFFQNPLSEAYLLFLHSLVNVFHINIKKMERENNSLLEVIEILETVESALEERILNNFFPILVLNVLKKNNDCENHCLAFRKNALGIYTNCLDYLREWTKQFADFSVFKWMELKSEPTWEEISSSVEYLYCKDFSVIDSALINQFSNLKIFLNVATKEESFNGKLSHEKWVEFFKQVSNPEQHSEFLKICEYFFSIPGHNANVERIFSIMNSQWTDERNRLSVTTVESILITKFNFKGVVCSDFYKLIMEDKEALNQVRTSEKYDTKESIL